METNINHIDKFIDIIKTKNFNNIKIVANHIIEIMMNIDEIDKKLAKQNISIIDRIDGYNFIFNDEIYNKIYQSAINCTTENYNVSNDDYLKYFMHYAIFCELYKISMYEHVLDNINNMEQTNKLVIDACYDTFGNYKKTSTNSIIMLTNNIKTHFVNNEIWQETLKILPDYLKPNN